MTETDWLEIIKWFFPLKNLLDDPGKTANWIPVLFIPMIVLFTVGFLLSFRSKRKAFQSWLVDIIADFTGLSHQEMVGRFDAINEEFSRDERYGHHWREFAATLVRRKKPNGSTEIFRTIDARYFFNESSLIEPNLDLRLYNSIPGILTGLGILGTFVGLSYGLSHINLEVSTAEFQTSVGELLAGAGIAFSTSLWGIGLSIAFSFYEKRQVHGLNKEVQRFQEAIDQTFVKRTSDYWLSESLQENVEQTTQLKRFNDELAYSIAQALDEKIAGRLTTSLDRFMEVVDELKTYKVDSSESTLRQMVEEFSSKLSAGANEEMENIARALTDVAATLESTADQSSSNQSQMEQNFSEHINRMVQTVTDLMESVGTSQQSLNSLNQNSMEELLVHVKQSMEAQQHELEGISSRSQENMDANLQAISDRMSALLNQVTEKAEGVSKVLDDRMSNLTERFDTSLLDVTARYEQERGALGLLIQKLEQSLHAMEGLSTGMAEAGESMRQSAVPMVEAAKDLVRGVTSLRHAQDSFSTSVASAQERSLSQFEKAEETLRHIREALASTKESWKSYSSNFDGLRDDLDSVFRSLNAGLSDYSTIVNESVNKYLTGLDDNLAKSVNLLGGAVENLQEAVDDLSESRSGGR